MKKVYLAGPDVFFHDALLRAEKNKTLCLSHGFEPLHPADGIETTASGIYQANIQMIQQADAVLANLNPFRGAEPDSGTAFEVGYAAALKIPIIGYLDGPTDIKDQVKKYYGPIYFDESKQMWLDQNENMVEDFGLPVNLMLGVSAKIVFGDLLTAIVHLQGHLYD